MESTINEISGVLKSSKKDMVNKIQSTLDDNKTLEKEIEKLKSNLTLSKLDDIIDGISNIDGIDVIYKKLDNLDGNSLRELGDSIKDKLGSVLVVLGSSKDNKVSLIAMATKDLVSKGIHAGNIIKEIAKVTGGGGGGRPDMAQAGGKDASKIEQALNMVPEIIKSQLK